jgi:hypothetical protein
MQIHRCAGRVRIGPSAPGVGCVLIPSRCGRLLAAARRQGVNFGWRPTCPSQRGAQAGAARFAFGLTECRRVQVPAASLSALPVVERWVAAGRSQPQQLGRGVIAVLQQHSADQRQWRTS